jgi:integrase
MPREKKNKVRKDGRFRRRYKGIEFYSYISDEDAKAQRDEYKAREKAGLLKKATVADYGLPWLKRTFPEVANSTYTGLAIHLQHLIDEIGDKQISEVVPSNIKDVYTNQYKNCSSSYLKSAKQLFSSLFDSAVADGLCRSNPARDRTAKPHKGSEPKTRPITPQEREWINTLCLDHRCRPAVMTMLYAGLRPPEAKAFRIDRDVDFENDTITLQEFAHNDPDNLQHYEFTDEGKTADAVRKIPLFPPLKEALRNKTGDLISSAHGERVTKTTWRVAWNSYCHCMETAINGMEKRWYGRTKEHKKLLAEKKPLPEWISFDIVPYDLRHSFCVMCRDAGVDINTCRKWMGHADSKMILKVYDAVSEDRSENERKKVENQWFGGQNGGQNKNPSHDPVEK